MNLITEQPSQIPDEGNHTGVILHKAFIQMPLKVYQIMVARMYKQHTKLKAVSNLHAIISNKELVIKDIMAKNKQLESSIHIVEARLSKFLNMYFEKSSEASGHGFPEEKHMHDKKNNSFEDDPSVLWQSKSKVTPSISTALFDRVIAENVKLRINSAKHSDDSPDQKETKIQLAFLHDQRKLFTSRLQAIGHLEKKIEQMNALLVGYLNEYESLRLKTECLMKVNAELTGSPRNDVGASIDPGSQDVLSLHLRAVQLENKTLLKELESCRAEYTLELRDLKKKCEYTEERNTRLIEMNNKVEEQNKLLLTAKKENDVLKFQLADAKEQILRIATERDNISKLYQLQQEKISSKRSLVARPPFISDGKDLRGMPIAASGCGMSVSADHAPWKVQTYRHDSLMIDAIPSTSQEDDIDDTVEDINECSSSPYICKRCDREFAAAEQTKYKDHISKCTDD